MGISVVIPLYNSENTIENTINSVLDQTTTHPIELIIVNDGSSDRSREVVEAIIEKNNTNRVIKLINKENEGVSITRNIGVKASSGEYIAFLDSDDVWHPEKLELIMKKMTENKINFIGHAYTLLETWPKIEGLDKLEKINFFTLLIKNFAVTPSVVLKKNIFEDFNEKMSHTEDHELWLRIALNHDVYFLDSPLVKLSRPELSAGGLSSDLWKMRKGEIQMFINIAKRKKALIPSVPFLIGFSLLKHARKTITNQINRLKKEGH